jgi:predicted nucleotidyltransferase
MASTQPRIEIPQAEIEAFCRRWDVVELALFGSVMRDDFRPDSDIDVMVKFAPNRRLHGWGIVDMKLELEDLLGRRVDLVEPGSVQSATMRRSMMRDQAVIYAA